MICVYPADCTDFSTNGNGTLAPLSAEVTETLNGEYELTLVHPIDEAGKWQRLVEGCINAWGTCFSSGFPLFRWCSLQEKRSISMKSAEIIQNRVNTT